ncbi:sugar-binding protein, partial [Candidatus Magnetomorum sp. HK-1]
MSNPITSEYRSYKYDNIGNRENAIDWDDINKDLQSTYYESNSLNQYVQTDDGKEQNSFVYDADGNLTSVISSNGDVMMYTYNCENRLIAAGPANPDEGDLKGEYLYDYMGRRIQKKVYEYTGVEWKLNETRLFVWDGWNMIEEVVQVVSEVEYSKYYVWGLDLS